eukprot:1160143-Pelagomonas_calceolata.AAC.1
MVAAYLSHKVVIDSEKQHKEASLIRVASGPEWPKYKNHHLPLRKALEGKRPPPPTWASCQNWIFH